MAGQSKNARVKTEGRVKEDLKLGTAMDTVIEKLAQPVAILIPQAPFKKTGWKKDKNKVERPPIVYPCDVIAKDSNGKYYTQMKYVKSSLMDPFKNVHREITSIPEKDEDQTEEEQLEAVNS